MASYIQGITDYIPHIQPFQPDLNFYQKALESKEAAYKSGYDKISKVYGTLLNSQMLRKDNNETRDKFFSQIQNDIQRLSSVDLSLQQNVNTAYSVFQPLIEDKHITKDMVFTKKYNSQKQYAQYLKTCLEKECEGKYWDEGVRALNYQAEDFIEADKEEALGMADPSYTPNSDGFNKAMKLAKEMGVEIQNVSHDPTGAYIVTTKNGSQLTGPLANYLSTAMASNGSVMAAYYTKAYVARKDYAANNAAQYGGDKLAAERAYLAAAEGNISEVMEHFYGKSKEALSSQETKKKIMDKKIEKEGINPTAQKDFVNDWYSTQEQIAVNSQAVDDYGSTITSLRGADKNDLNNLRVRIDRAMGKAFMLEDMQSAAKSYANLHKSVSMTADPFALKAVDHQYALDTLNKKFQYDVFLEKYKNDLKNGMVAGPREWTTSEMTSGDTGKQAARTTVADLEGRLGKEAQIGGLEYLQKTYDFYNAMRQSKDPDRAKYGAEKLKEIFKDNIDKAYQLQDLANSPTVNVEGSPDSWKAIYTRAVQAVKGDRSIINLDDQNQLSQFNQMEAGITRKLNAYETVAGKSMKNNKNIATWVRYNGKSDYKGDIDLLIDKDGREQTKAKFIVDWNNRHQRMGDPFFGQDPGEIYDELAEEFTTSYNNKDAPIEDVYSGRVGAGGIGQVPMKTTYDSATISLDDRKDLLSLREDLNRKGSFVMKGGNIAGEEGKFYSEANDNKGARQLLDEILDYTTRGGWDPRTEAGKKRPIFELIASGTALGRPDYQAYTIKIDPIFADTLRGTGTRAGIAKNFFDDDGNLIDDKITLYIKDSEAKNNFSQRFNTSDYDIIMANNGKYVIDGYADGGGTVEVSRDQYGRLAGTPTIQWVKPDGTYESEVLQRFYSDDPLTSTEDFIAGQEAMLKQLQIQNQLQREQILKSLPKTKSLQ